MSLLLYFLHEFVPPSRTCPASAPQNIGLNPFSLVLSLSLPPPLSLVCIAFPDRGELVPVYTKKADEKKKNSEKTQGPWSGASPVSSMRARPVLLILFFVFFISPPPPSSLSLSLSFLIFSFYSSSSSTGFSGTASCGLAVSWLQIFSQSPRRSTPAPSVTRLSWEAERPTSLGLLGCRLLPSFPFSPLAAPFVLSAAVRNVHAGCRVLRRSSTTTTDTIEGKGVRAAVVPTVDKLAVIYYLLLRPSPRLDRATNRSGLPSLSLA